MIDKLKGNWQGCLVVGVVGLWVAVFTAIFYASAQAGCTDNDPMSQLHGLCLARRLAGLSCFLGMELAFGMVAGLQTKAKRHGFLLGFILGFFLNFPGGLIALALSPRGERCPRCGRRKPPGREGLCLDCFLGRPPSPRPAISPEMRRRRIVIVAITILALIVLVFQVLRNLGKI